MLIETIKTIRDEQGRSISSSSSSFYPINCAMLSQFLDVVRKKDIPMVVNWLTENKDKLKSLFHQAENNLFQKDKPFGCGCFGELQHHLEGYATVQSNDTNQNLAV